MVAGVALWLMVSEPVTAPVAFGAKAIIIVQLAPTASVCGSVQVDAAIRMVAGDTVVEETISGAVPELVIVTALDGDCTPTGVSPNARVVAFTEAAGAVTVLWAPVPASATVLVVGVALCVMVTFPVRLPVAVGVNTTLTLHCACGAMVAPARQEFTVAEKSLPDNAKALMVNAAEPVLVKVTVWLADVAPRLVEAKVSAAVDKLADGAPATTVAPVPLSASVLVAGVALWAIVSVPLRAPAAVGVNVIDTVQVPAAARLVPDVQVVALMAKSAPLKVVAPNTNAAVPTLVSVTVWAAAVVPTLVLA